MRIARPKPPDAPFKRRRSPPPQATKLLRWSMVSALVFIILLAIVFIPRGLIVTPRVAVFELRSEAGPRAVVTNATDLLELTAFRAVFIRDTAVLATLGPGLEGGSATFNFTDANADDKLGPGDYFEFDASVDGVYRLEIRLVYDGRLLGIMTWRGILS